MVKRFRSLALGKQVAYSVTYSGPWVVCNYRLAAVYLFRLSIVNYCIPDSVKLPVEQSSKPRHTGRGDVVTELRLCPCVPRR